MVYYDVIEVRLDRSGDIRERNVGSKRNESEAKQLMRIAQKLNRKKEYYIREDSSLDY